MPLSWVNGNHYGIWELFPTNIAHACDTALYHSSPFLHDL